jgi:hypothetical protein
MQMLYQHQFDGYVQVLNLKARVLLGCLGDFESARESMLGIMVHNLIAKGIVVSHSSIISNDRGLNPMSLMQTNDWVSGLGK